MFIDCLGRTSILKKEVKWSVFRPKFYLFNSNFDLNHLYNSKCGTLTFAIQSLLFQTEFQAIFQKTFLFFDLTSVIWNISIFLSNLYNLNCIEFDLLFQKLLNSNKTVISLKFELERFDCMYWLIH